MSVNPYLIFVVGIESQKDDPRFSNDRLDLNLANSGSYWGEMRIPPLCEMDQFGVWEDFDFVVGKPLKYCQERPLMEEMYYSGNPAGNHAWRVDGQPVGYVVEGCQAQDLLRVLSLVPGFEGLFGEKGTGGHIVLKSREPEDHAFEYMHACGGRVLPGEERTPYQVYQKQRVDKAVAEGRWIEMFKPWSTNIWFCVALHLLHLAGWVGVERKDLKLMVVFSWA